MAEQPRFIRVTSSSGVKTLVNVDRIDAILEPSALTQNLTGIAVSGQAYPCRESVDEVVSALGAKVVDVDVS
ncbi:hypothetical protein [Nocardia salmonicida]|uniref:hypothetical protein n=1 Tax=Nocardia salmonicida TaxID=53431 RepID=UPI0007A39382|nr:hypothetical protein [Nocardia salmonicida]